MGTETTTTPAPETQHGAAPSEDGVAPAAEVARTVTVEAPDEERARAAAAQQLGAPVGEVVLRVASRRKKGLFGLGGQVLTVEASWTPAPPPPPPAPAEPPRIDITCMRGRLSLAVHRPEGRARPADAGALDTLIEGWPLDARDEAAVQQALRLADGRPRVFATMAPTTMPPDGAAAAVRIAKDDQTAWLIPWNPEPLDGAALAELVASAGVSAGLDEQLMADLAGQVLARPVVIARGKLPHDGADARAEFVFQELAGDADRKPTVTADGKVDFRETGGGPRSVQPGDVLVRKVPLIEAENGGTVRGKTLPAKKPRDLELRRLAGQNTKVTEDGQAVVATTGGLAGRVSEKIVVLPIHTVEGDVDFKTGNVYFEGNLQIRGGVKPGFKVTATGSVQIGGTVEAAVIEAGADVVISGGIVGQKEGVVRAGGAVSARFIQECEIHAGGPVTIASEIRESTVISERSVTVAGAGRIVGGLVRGRDQVEARIVGSPSATPTTVQAGWGAELEVEVSDEVRIPKLIIRDQIHGGVLLTVAGASQRYTRGTTGGVWREKDGKLMYSAS